MKPTPCNANPNTIPTAPTPSDITPVQRLITKTLQLTAELARVRGLPNPEQLAVAELRTLEPRRAELLAPSTDTAPATSLRPPRPEHGPRSQPTLPVVGIRHEL